MLLDINSALVIIETELKKLSLPETPRNLYDPVRYILSNGGKRIRPALTLLACNMFTDDYLKAINPALGIEIFHNFTLLHDDLMDNSPVRRNDPTVHIKWNPNIAILSGDVMSILASQLISHSEKEVMPAIQAVFNKTALEVCEGQMMDMDFEKRMDVTVEEYINMIGLKTSVLLAASLRIGSMAGGADEKGASDIYHFGYNLGIGFQLQDDLLDTFGELGKFGKKIGNDIITNKKTYLYLKALELAEVTQRETLINLYSGELQNQDEKILKVKDIFESLNVRSLTEMTIKGYFGKALELLKKVNVAEERKTALIQFAEGIMKRES
jgi:geranylgeranyl diphosphate synthase, type II